MWWVLQLQQRVHVMGAAAAAAWGWCGSFCTRGGGGGAGGGGRPRRRRGPPPPPPPPPAPPPPSQMASPTFTPVYAALVAVVNTKFPELGELLLHRVITQVGVRACV